MNKLLTVLCLGFLLTACGNTKKQENKSEATPITKQGTTQSDEQAGVTEFYKAYLKGDLTSAEQDSLMDKFFTKPMQEKVGRISEIVNADALIRAQDYTAQGLETLDVKPLGDNWFMVHFFWDKNDPSTENNIPVKAEMIDGQCKIIYVTPEYNGQQYGDSLIAESTKGWRSTMDVSHASAEAFVKSFYKLYASTYCHVDESMHKRLKIWRAEYLSDRALTAYSRERAKRLMDIDNSYDWVINNSDFDAMWFETLRVTKVSNYRYNVMNVSTFLDKI